MPRLPTPGKLTESGRSGDSKERRRWWWWWHASNPAVCSPLRHVHPCHTEHMSVRHAAPFRRRRPAAPQASPPHPQALTPGIPAHTLTPHCSIPHNCPELLQVVWSGLRGCVQTLLCGCAVWCVASAAVEFGNFWFVTSDASCLLCRRLAALAFSSCRVL